jgi:hypothetical protein
MTFVLRNKQDVLTGIMNDLRDSGISYIGRNSKARVIAAALSREFDIAYRFFDSNFDQAYLNNASNDLLAALGVLFGVRRIVARKAISSIFERNIAFYVQDGTTFADINNGNEFTIPAGTIIRTPETVTGVKQIEYQLLADVVCTSTSRIAFATAEALVEGRSSNVGRHSLVEHSFVGYTDAAASSLKVINRYAIVNGTNQETDEEMRSRIAIAATAQQAGNLTAIRFALLSVPGVIDISLIPYFDGIGTVGAFIAGQDNSVAPSLVAQGQAAVTEFVSAGEDVTVYSPNRVGIDFTTHVNLSREVTINERNQIERNLLDAANRFFTNLGIGDDIDLSEFITALQRSNNLIVNFGVSPSTTQFDQLNLYRYSDASGERVRKTLLDTTATINIEDHELFIPELSVVRPFQFTFDPISS